MDKDKRPVGWDDYVDEDDDQDDDDADCYCE
jgi:hypothetical protein